MNFVTHEVKTQDLAEYLAGCRRRASLTVPEAAALSRIQPKFITAFEEGRLNDLPAPVYVKGFLKSLARAYRVSPDPLIDQYAAESALAANSAPEPEAKIPAARFIPKFVLSPRTITILSLSILGILSFAYLYFQVSSLRRPPVLEVALSEQAEATGSSFFQLQGKTEAGAAVSINGQPVVVDTDGKFQENLSLGYGANQLTIKSVNKFNQESVLVRSLIFSPKEIAGSSTINPESVSAPPAVSLELRMEDDSAWIEVEADGQKQYQGTMLPHSRRTVEAKNKVVLSTGNAGATRVVLNGKDLGVLGKPGETIRGIEFTK